MSTPPRPVSLSDLGALTTRGLTAFAARAARRAMPYYRPTTADEREAGGYFGNAIAYADAVAGGQDSELPAGLLDQLYVWADHVAATAGYAGFAAVHAARVAAKAPGGAADHTAHLDIVASTFGATRVVYTAAGDPAAAALDAAFRADFDTLVRLDLGTPGTAGRGVDPSPAGPLGPLLG